jgi:N-acyl amino acid synthase of PEP-CTERM/exosortase system
MLNSVMANTQPNQSLHTIPVRVMRSALELRYQVYCMEYHFLPQDDYPDGLETDEYDDQAAHFYTFDDQDELAGYVRLVRPDFRQRLPLHGHCTLSLRAGEFPDHRQAAEVSRLMVRSDFRRPRCATLTDMLAPDAAAAIARQKREEAAHIVLSLYRQMYAYSCANGIRYWYAAMERPLARSLHSRNFAFRSIGPQTDYYGPVAPYLADLRELEAQVGENNPALLSWMQAPECWFGHSTYAGEWGFLRNARSSEHRATESAAAA